VIDPKRSLVASARDGKEIPPYPPFAVAVGIRSFGWRGAIPVRACLEELHLLIFATHIEIRYLARKVRGKQCRCYEFNSIKSFLRCSA
jgi:hypothetical protein